MENKHLKSSSSQITKEMPNVCCPSGFLFRGFSVHIPLTYIFYIYFLIYKSSSSNEEMATHSNILT